MAFASHGAPFFVARFLNATEKDCLRLRRGHHARLVFLFFYREDTDFQFSSVLSTPTANARAGTCRDCGVCQGSTMAAAHFAHWCSLDPKARAPPHWTQ